MASWLDDFGPAEFDRTRMPKSGRKPRDAGQAGLFMMAAEPLPAKTPVAEEMPGQESMFGPDSG